MNQEMENIMKFENGKTYKNKKNGRLVIVIAIMPFTAICKVVGDEAGDNYIIPLARLNEWELEGEIK